MKKDKKTKLNMNKETLSNLSKVNGGGKCSIVLFDTVANCQGKKDKTNHTKENCRR